MVREPGTLVLGTRATKLGPLMICAFLLWMGMGTARASEISTAGKLPVLTTAHSVHSLTSEEASREYPVRLHGVLTYFDPHIDPRRAFLFVHDATGDIFVSLANLPTLPIVQGEVVEIQGESERGEFAPIVGHAHVEVVGHTGQLPQVESKVLLPLMISSYDGRWIEVEGVVQDVSGSRWNMVLKLATVNGVIRATTVREEGVNYSRLIGARVRVQGNAVPKFNRRRQITGASLYFQAVRNVVIEQAQPQDPFAGSKRAIDKLIAFEPGMSALESVHIQGRVTLQWPGRYLCVQDESGGLCVQAAQDEPLAEGDLVDVVGFPDIGEAYTGLSEARFRKAGEAAVLSPIPITAREALQGDHPGELVTITGKLISTTWGLKDGIKNPTLMLEADGRVFPAVLPSDSRMLGQLAHTTGSILRLTGVCMAEASSGELEVQEGEVHFESFRILLRSPADVEVITTPPWWDAGHTVAVLETFTATTMVVLGWVFFLRRRVSEQTHLIRVSEERFRHLAQHDGLTGLANRALLGERLEQAIAQADWKRTLAVLMIDLDHFKQVNDRYGHHTGDLLLCTAAKRLSGCVRKTDTVSRTGGDEFVVLLSKLHHALEAAEIAAKIVSALAVPLDVEGQMVPLSVSVGVCTFPDGGWSASSLLRNADTALYGAKALGRNCYQQFSPLQIEQAVPATAAERRGAVSKH